MIVVIVAIGVTVSVVCISLLLASGIWHLAVIPACSLACHGPPTAMLIILFRHQLHE